MVLPVLLSLTVCSLHVDWEKFLSKYSMEWKWQDMNTTSIRLQDNNISNCGEGGCCITAGNMTISMQECNGNLNQEWIFQNQKMISVENGKCIEQVGSRAVLGNCSTSLIGFSYGSVYVINDTKSPPPYCLTVVSKPFCNGTICPESWLSMITSGQLVGFEFFENGNRAQMFKSKQLLPNDWTTAPYIGNGEVGVRLQYPVVLGSRTSTLQLVLDNSFFGANSHRYPSGYFNVTFDNSVPSTSPLVHNVSVDISTGVLKGFVSQLGSSVPLVSYNSYVHSTEAVLVFSVESTVELNTNFIWVPKNDSSHLTNINYSVMRESSVTTLVATISREMNTSQSRVSEAVKQLTADPQQFYESHRVWWLSYWNSSFVTIPDPLVEENYYTQLYRFASSDRVTLHGLDGDFGPTKNPNVWPDDVWDMNEEVMYWITEGSNKPDLVLPLLKFFLQESQAKRWPGNIWMAHKMNKHISGYGGELSSQLGVSELHLQKVLFEELQTLLQSEIGLNKTQHDTGKLLVDDKGTYHVTQCKSPEYRCYPPFESLACEIKTDCNFELSQLRWALRRVCELSMELEIPLEAESYWKNLLKSKLVGYPIDPVRGYKLSAECSFLCPHRHFSHLLMMYDLELPDVNSHVAKMSLDNWYSITCNSSNVFNEECRGFTQCGMAMMSADLGRKNASVGNVTNLIINNLSPNGMYGESNRGYNPNEFSSVAESGYCTAAVVNTIMFHVGSDNILRLFFSVPDSWSDAQFYNLRTMSGHLVSAKMTNDTIEFISISSQYKSSLSSVLVHLPWDLPEVSPNPISFKSVGDSVWNLTLSPSVEYTLFKKNTTPNMIFSPIPGPEFHYFGYARPHVPIH